MPMFELLCVENNLLWVVMSDPAPFSVSVTACYAEPSFRHVASLQKTRKDKRWMKIKTLNIYK